MLSFFKDLIGGNITLWKTFWVGFILPQMIMNAFYKSAPGRIDQDILLVIGILHTLYNIIALIGTWNSASKYQKANPSYSYIGAIAKAIVIFAFITLIPMLFRLLYR